MNAFVDTDIAAARETRLRDDEVDDINREIIDELHALMQQRPAVANPR